METLAMHWSWKWFLMSWHFILKCGIVSSHLLNVLKIGTCLFILCFKTLPATIKWWYLPPNHKYFLSNLALMCLFFVSQSFNGMSQGFYPPPVPGYWGYPGYPQNAFMSPFGMQGYGGWVSELQLNPLSAENCYYVILWYSKNVYFVKQSWLQREQ